MPQSSNNKDNGKNDNTDLLTSSAKGAYYLVLLQFASRMLTFGLHQIVLRYTTAEVLGIASVKLELLLSTILFISREGFRCALLRGEGDNAQSSKQAEQKVTNLAYIPTVLGLATTLLACGYYLYQIDEATAIKYPFYRTSVVLFGAAAFAELLVEPLFVLAMNRLYFQLRVSVEGVAVISRTFVTFGLTLWGASTGSNAFGVLAFAAAQLVFGLTMAAGYLGFFLKKVRRSEMDARELYPRKLRRSDDTSYWFDSDMLTLATTLTKQSLLKHILTEGDKMLISALTTDENQGVYAFVVNYGSLIVRILFQPLEETSRTFFSKILADASKKADTTTAAEVLLMILQFHILLGLLFVCFATNYTGALIDLLVGKEWSVERNGPAVLAVYCAYVPVMGVNGITEAFVQAVASKSDLQTLSYYMVAFSACFMASGYLFMSVLDLGAIGLVLANIVNLGIRIAYSWSYITKYFEKSTVKRPLAVRNWFPRLPTLLVFVLSWIVTSYSEQTIGWQTLNHKVLHIGIGVLCFLVTAGVTVWQEKSWINDMRRMMKSGKTE